MYVGHFAGTEILHDFFPQTPRWVALTGVSFRACIELGLMLIAGFVLNLLNVNSACGFTKANPLKSPRVFAISRFGSPSAACVLRACYTNTPALSR